MRYRRIRRYCKSGLELLFLKIIRIVSAHQSHEIFNIFIYFDFVYTIYYSILLYTYLYTHFSDFLVPWGVSGFLFKKSPWMWPFSCTRTLRVGSCYLVRPSRRALAGSTSISSQPAQIASRSCFQICPRQIIITR